LHSNKWLVHYIFFRKLWLMVDADHVIHTDPNSSCQLHWRCPNQDLLWILISLEIQCIVT
jgi:hypothetical protein